jgi:hypothetical protein
VFSDSQPIPDSFKRSLIGLNHLSSPPQSVSVVSNSNSRKKKKTEMAHFASLLLIVAGVCYSATAAVIDTDSPSPASQRLVPVSRHSVDSSEMFASAQKRPMETIDDLMNALAQVTKSKGKY